MEAGNLADSDTSGGLTPIFTKEQLITSLRAIAARGWVPNARPGNAGGVGNTLEDLLGIPENNLPIPNAAEWELKAQRSTNGRANSLTTLFHIEPSPPARKLVPALLLPKYGWPHRKAGNGYASTELSFRQTLSGSNRSDRGFGVVIDHAERKISISFSAADVDARHQEWLTTVAARAGLAELDPMPYWGFDDLHHKAGTKLKNCFYAYADCKKVGGVEFYCYRRILMLRGFDFDRFLLALEAGTVLIDFDARTGHNHGTKFRLRQNAFPTLYAEVDEIAALPLPEIGPIPHGLAA